ncbi:MAG: HAD-IIB family hydrolase [Gallionella sp.]|nr:HAD-IIB family hydrolase [Gallionella sp.]
MTRRLLCTDLDRTLIPNGAQAESPGAREHFRQLVGREEVTLAYVSGRHRALIEQGIAEYGLPQPDYAIADVGATIYRVKAGSWEIWEEWEAQIAPDWRGLSHHALRDRVQISPALKLQEQEKQNRHKLSFYLDPGADIPALLECLREVLAREGIKANLIYSMDEAATVGLLDVLPASANKLRAIRFLMETKQFALADTLFAGDSGNDLDVLLGEVPSVLVANAASEVRELTAAAHHRSLYFARGGYLGMNGNYSAGILEGAAHFWPEADGWLRQQTD